MLRNALLIGTCLLMVAAITVPGMSAGKQGRAGKSNIAHLDLYPGGAEPEPDAWGKVKFNISGETLDYVLNAHDLTPGVEYILKSGGVVYGSDTADEWGNVHFKGCIPGEEADGRRFNIRYAMNNARVLWSDVIDFEYTGE